MVNHSVKVYMDRMFLIQQEWHDDKGFPDPAVLVRLFAYRCPYYLDKWQFWKSDLDPIAAIDDFKSVPVGTIQFVSKWLEALGGKDSKMTPLEVPKALRGFVNREYFMAKGKDIPSECRDASKWFLKDADHLKKWNSLLYDDGDLSYYIEPETLYAVSERVVFESEYRTFVYEDEVVGCENYMGSPTVFPNGSTLDEMVKAYSEVSHPRAYTLDIGVLAGGITVPLEIHPFVSCGLYGFNDRVLLNMYEAGWDWYMFEFSEEGQ